MAAVETFPTPEAPAPRLADVRALLDEAFAGAFSDDDWDHTLGGWHVVVLDGEEFVSHAAVVPRDIWIGRRRFACGYVEGVATAPRRHGEGLGSLAVAEAGRIIRGSFELGALSTDRHSFYAHLGWERWRGPTFVRPGDGTFVHPGDGTAVRTPDEDDGVMVLRFGESADVDLSEAVTCRDRRGDAW